MDNLSSTSVDATPLSTGVKASIKAEPHKFALYAMILNLLIHSSSNPFVAAISKFLSDALPILNTVAGQ